MRATFIALIILFGTACGVEDRFAIEETALPLTTTGPAMLCPDGSRPPCIVDPDDCPCGVNRDGSCKSCTIPIPPLSSVSLGFFCPSWNMDVVFACGVDARHSAYMTTSGWVNQGAGCFHRATSQYCSPVEYAGCASSGIFCNSGSGTLTQFICNCTASPTFGWVPQPPSACFHRTTGVPCL